MKKLSQNLTKDVLVVPVAHQKWFIDAINAVSGALESSANDEALNLQVGSKGRYLT